MGGFLNEIQERLRDLFVEKCDFEGVWYGEFLTPHFAIINFTFLHFSEYIKGKIIISQTRVFKIGP